MAYWQSAGFAPVRIAVVGLGYWGPNLVRNLHELPDAELAAACDLRSDMLEKVSRRYPGVPVTQSFKQILDDESIEAVCIATPVPTHHPLALAALNAGKNVFIEKPLAASADQAAELVEVAERADRILMPGHTFLYSPPVNIIRGLIEAGELGDIYFVSTSRVNLGLHQPDASVVWDLAPHDFSILRYWLNETPTHVSAISRGCIMPVNTRCRVHQSRVRLGGRRARGALVARTEQAPAHHRRRLAKDGRLRRHEQRAGARIRLRCDAS